MYEEMKDWVAVVIPQFEIATGQWQEATTDAESWYAVVYADGGPRIEVDTRRPNFKILLLGPRDGRRYNKEVYDAAQSLINAALGDFKPCGAADVKVMSEPSGISYTTENRAWASVDFQVIF